MTTAQTGTADPVDSPPPAASPVNVPLAPARGRWSAWRSPRPWSAWRPRRADLVALAVFVIAACWVTGRLWVSRDNLALVNPGDQTWFEWELAHGARVVSHLENPFFTTRLNAPVGVNMMVNNSLLGLSIPFAPVTLLFGPHVTFVLLTTLSLVAAGWGWYHVLSRHLVRSPVAAFLGGALCAFGPGIISHAQGQLNLVTNFVLPFIVLRVLKLREPDRPVRAGVILGLLAAYQVFLSEEILFIAAVGCLLFVLAYVAFEPAVRRRPVLRGAAVTIGVATVVGGAIIAYPVWFQFFGPQHYRGIMAFAAEWGAPVLSYGRVPGTSVGGVLTGDTASGNEQNAFFGPVLVAMLVAYAFLRRRRPGVRAATYAMLVLVALSFGPSLARYHDLKPTIIDGHMVAGPYLLLRKLPLFDALVPSRLALAVLVFAGVLLALACDELVPWLMRQQVAVALAGYAVLAAALVPLVPMPIEVVQDPPIPAFIADGTYRRYVDDRHTLVTVPVPTNYDTRGMRWAASTCLGFRLENGYFLGPTSSSDLRATFSPDPRALGYLVNTIDYSGVAPQLTEDDKRAVVADLRYWRAAIVVLTPTATQELMRRTLDELLGPGTYLDGVWMWDVRTLVDTP